MEREAGCFIGCDVKQDGGSPRGIKQREEGEDAATGRRCHFDFQMTEMSKGTSYCKSESK